MKKLLYALILLSNVGWAQDSTNYQTEIQRDFRKYNAFIIDEEYEKSVNYMPEEFFDYIEKEDLIQAMKNTMNNPDILAELEMPKNIICSEPKEAESKHYSRITYTSELRIKFLDDEKLESEEEKRLQKKWVRTALEERYGADNLSYNTETEYYTIHSAKTALGISKDGIENWRFLLVEPEQEAIIREIVPEVILIGFW